MIAAITDALGHGILPFTGRTEEVQRIIRFWRGTFHAARLRALLVTGEAGVGKTSLLEEAIRKVEEEGGTTIQARLYPETTVSIAQILSRSLWLAPGSRPLLKTEPEATISSIIAALRRIIRLRPTLLVVDNLHLLDQSLLADFATLIDALADEPLALAVTLRPTESAVRPILERVLADQIVLKGLREEEIDDLCASILGSPATETIVGDLYAASLGNPLALRSAVRGALIAGTIERNGPAGRWDLRVPVEQFRERIAADVKTLSTGMIIHLSDAERHAARTLAALGEVFSQEAAEALLGPDPEILHGLETKGIVIPAALSAIPLPGAVSRSGALAFSHSLLHRVFLDSTEIDPDRLAAVVIDRLPLYSIVPYQLIADGADLEISAAALEALIECALDSSRVLEYSPDWKLSLDIAGCAGRTLARYGDLLSERRRRLLHLQILELQMKCLSRDKQGSEFAQVAGSLLEATACVEDREIAHFRIATLSQYLDGFDGARVINGVNEEIVAEIEKIFDRFPDLRAHDDYLVYIEALSRVAMMVGNRPFMRSMSSMLDDLLASPDLDDEFKRTALERIGPRMLLVFDTREELDERVVLLRRLEQSNGLLPNRFRRMRAIFLKTISRYEETLEEIEQFLPELVDIGLKRIRPQWLAAREAMRMAFGSDPETVEREVRTIHDAAPEDGKRHLRRYIGGTLASAGMRSGNFPWAGKMMQEYCPNDDENGSTQRFVRMLAARDEHRMVLHDGDEESAFYGAALLLTGAREVTREEVQKGLAEVMHHGILNEEDLTLVHITLETFDQFAPRFPMLAAIRDELRPAIRTTLIEALELLDRQRMFAWMTSIIERWGTYLSSREVKRWRARIAEVQSSWEADHPVSADKRSIRVSMFGRIGIALGGEEPKATRGSRLRTLLGLMVANQVLDHPLTLEEFCAIAESDLDFERAKNNLYVGIHRLREAVGHDAVLTDQRTPRLNPEIVRVDLIEAHSLLAEANSALRTGHLIRAWSALRNALEITGGEVPYPTLYDGFFEAARQDFELLLRETTIAVARAFLLEEDASSAAKVLKLAIASAPGDDELSELLAEALIRSGKRAEAQRVRLRSGLEESVHG